MVPIVVSLNSKTNFYRVHVGHLRLLVYRYLNEKFPDDEYDKFFSGIIPEPEES